MTSGTTALSATALSATALSAGALSTGAPSTANLRKKSHMPPVFAKKALADLERGGP